MRTGSPWDVPIHAEAHIGQCKTIVVVGFLLGDHLSLGV